MAKKERPFAARYALTEKQTARIMEHFMYQDSFSNDEEIGMILALLRALTYSDRREDILNAVENELLPYSIAVGEAFDALCERTLKQFRKGVA